MNKKSTSLMGIIMGGSHLSDNFESDENQSYESHHGVLQFIHAQGEKEKGMEGVVKNMKDWGQFCYKVHLGTIGSGDQLSAYESEFPFIAQLLQTNAFKGNFGERDGKATVSVQQLFNGARDDMMKNMALGSFLHMIMDSFNQAHGQRAEGKRKVEKPQTKAEIEAGKEKEYIWVADLKNVTDYGLQEDHSKGDVTVSNPLMNPVRLAFKYESSKHKTIGYDDSVDACAQVIKMAYAKEAWETVETFINDIFRIDDMAKGHEAQNTKVVSGVGGKAERTSRGVPAQGRLFRKKENSIEAVIENFCDIVNDADKDDKKSGTKRQRPKGALKELRGRAKKYGSAVKDRIKKLNLILKPIDRLNQLYRHRELAIDILAQLNGIYAKVQGVKAIGLHGAYEIAKNEVEADLLDIEIDHISLLREEDAHGRQYKLRGSQSKN